jgi:hypothetical protein
MKHDISRAVTLTLDPAKVPAEVLQRFMRPGESAAALMERCSRYTWRKDEDTGARRMVQTYSGGTPEEREPLRRAMVRYINYLWNKARTRMARRYPMQYVRVVELHDDTVRPHIHLLVSAYVPREYWRQVWTAAGGGRRLDVHRVKDRIDEAARYLMKYLTKAAQSADPEIWPRGSRRIVVSRELSLTLNPEEIQRIAEYRKAEKTPDGACLGDYTPEMLERENFTQCKGCIWRKRRVCKWKPPGWLSCELYDSRRGIRMFPVHRSNEEEIDHAWWSIAARAAYRIIPWWARGDKRTEEMMFNGKAVDIMGKNCIPFVVDPYLYKCNNQVELLERGEE